MPELLAEVVGHWKLILYLIGIVGLLVWVTICPTGEVRRAKPHQPRLRWKKPLIQINQSFFRPPAKKRRYGYEQIGR